MKFALEVFEIFTDIQGESTLQGRPCVFVRLAGCPLACTYCDTERARESSGQSMSVEQVVSRVLAAKPRLVEVTGGEPLVQPATPELLTALCDAGLEVLLETSGAFPVKDLDRRVRVILDLKTPGSGMHDRMHLPNYDGLVAGVHELKIVVTSRADFDWARDFLRDRWQEDRQEVLFSPADGMVMAGDLASWMLETGCRGRLQLRLHRLIRPDSVEER